MSGVSGRITSRLPKIGRVWMAGVGAVCLAMVAVVPVTAQRVPIEQDLTASTLAGYTPPACVSGVPFIDITCTTGFDPWIEQFGADGITADCGGGKYCPSTPVTRDQMAVFIEKAMHGTGNWSPGDLGGANTGLGASALLHNSAYAQENTAIGYNALNAQSYANGNSIYFPANTAVGFDALSSNQPDGGNGSLNGNTTGYYNTASGVQSLASNPAGTGTTPGSARAASCRTLRVLRVATTPRAASGACNPTPGVPQTPRAAR